MIPDVIVRIYRRLEVVQEDVLPLTAVNPVTLTAREHRGVGREFLQGVHTATIASVQAIAYSRIDIGHGVYINECRTLECLGLTEFALGSLVE